MQRIALYMPGEAELGLMARLAERDDASVCAVVDPSGTASGSAMAEAVGLPVHLSFQAARLADDVTVVGDDADLGVLVRPLSGNGAPLPVTSTGAFAARLDDPESRDFASSPAPTFEPAAPPSRPVHEPPPAPPATRSATEAAGELTAIADLLDRDALLNRLLDVAMEASAADGGSLLLHDERSEELYFACARGLSLRVQQRTRIPLGVPVAGEVASARRPELLLSRPEGVTPGERGELSSALSLPLLHDGSLLGVLNLSRGVAATAFSQGDLTEAEALAPHLAAILARVDGVIGERSEEERRRLGRHLLDLAERADGLETALAGWAGALTMDLDASSASLAVVRRDGTLLLAEGDARGETRVGNADQTHPAWNEVLDTDRPVVARQSAAAGDRELTLFFQPVRAEGLRAVLGLSFADLAAAHRFQARCEAVVGLLERRLPGLWRRFLRCDQLARQARLMDLLGDIEDDDRLQTAAAEIVGARTVHAFSDGRRLSAASNTPTDDSETSRLRALLDTVAPGDWLIGTAEPEFGGSAGESLLVLADGRRHGSGFVFVGKERSYSGDDNVFTPFDADLARRCLAFLETPRPAPAASSVPAAAPPARTTLGTLIRREMDRSDRYHVAFSISVFRNELFAEARGFDVRELLDRLDRMVRISDHVCLLPDGIVLVLAPEETNAVSHLERRVERILRDFFPDRDLEIDRGRALYPGPYQTAEEMLAFAVAALDA